MTDRRYDNYKTSWFERYAAEHRWLDDTLEFFQLVGARSLSVLAWAGTIIMTIFFVLLFFALLAYPGEDNVWEVSQLLTFFNLLWMVPVVVLAFTGSSRLWDWAFGW